MKKPFLTKTVLIAMIVIFVLSSYVPVISSDETGSGAFSTTLYVGGTGPGNYSTIQSAVNDASNGDTVFVYNGTYYETFTLGKSIDLIGEDKLITIIDGDNGNNHIINIEKSNIYISGFTIRNSHKVGIYSLGNSNILIEDNIIQGNYRGGIECDQAINVTIMNNTFIDDGIVIFIDEKEDWNKYTIQDNTVNGNPLRYYRDVNDIIIPEDTGAVIIANCTNVIIHQLNLSYTAVGITISYSSNMTITSNILTSNTYSGIKIKSSADIYINNNTLSLNLNGIMAHLEIDQMFIENNNIQSNRDYGIFFWHIFEQDYEIYITGNNITDNNAAGINIYTLVFCHKYIINNNIDNNGNGIYLGYAALNNIIIGNMITRHDGYGIYTAPESGPTTVYHNEFYGNDDNVAGNGGTSGVWDDGYPTGGNYWDDYSGVDLYHGENQDIPGSDGIGDTPYQVVGDYVDNYPFMAPFGMKMVSDLEVQWNLISLPFNATVGKTQLQYYYNDTFYSWVEATTNENPTGQPLISTYYFDWDRMNQTYKFTSSLDKGYGYWFFAFEPGTFWIEDQNNTTDGTITMVYQGWNLISIPCGYSVNKNEIIVNNTEWDIAVSNGWISDYVFGWDRTGQNYEFCESFEPGKSYWLFATQICKLNL